MMLQEDTEIPNTETTSRRTSIESMSEDVMFYGLTFRTRLDF